MAWAVDRKYSASFGFALVILTTIAGLSYVSMMRSRATTQQTRHTQQILKQLESISSRIKDAETGQRGYLLTSNEHYLESYQNAIFTLDSDLNLLSQLLAAHSAKDDIIELRRLVLQRLIELQVVIHLRQTQSLAVAAKVVQANHDEQTMDQIHRVASRVETKERVLLDENIHNEDAADDQTTFFIIGGVLLEAITLSGIFFRLNQLYQSAQTQVQELEQLNQLKDDFLSTVSHELRTPIASIKMATQMLEISLQPLGVLTDASTPISRYFKVLREEGQREMSLINDLLDLTRLDAGTEPLNLTTIALQVYIPHLAESFVERTQQHQQQLVIQISDTLPLVTTDLSYLERILSELLHNACKYTPDGETITVSAQALVEVLMLRVTNFGVEIPTTEYDRIFDKFYRIPNSDPWKHGGTGLGLALVQKLTTQLGGQIHVESGDGQTTFILELKGCFQRSEGSKPMP